MARSWESQPRRLSPSGRRYKQSYHGVGKLLQSPEMELAMLLFAKKISKRAREIAPVDTGTYRRSIRASSGRRGGGVKNDRAYGSVIAHAPYSYHLEWGTSRTPKFRTLGRAIEAVTFETRLKQRTRNALSQLSQEQRDELAAD